MQSTDTKPNGPVAAVFLASGVGSLVLGLMVTLAEASADIKAFLDFSKNYTFLPAGVGPLSGKVIVATIAFALSWGVLHRLFRGREVAWGRVFSATLVLIAFGFALTFPPIFILFAPAE